MNNLLLIELHIPDFKRAKAFYSRLGFHSVWERQPSGLKGYLVMTDGNNILCFWGGNTQIYKHSYILGTIRIVLSEVMA